MRQLLKLLLCAPHHIGTQRAINEYRLLHCDGHLLAEPERLDSADIFPPDADDSARGIIEPLNELKHSRLPRAAVAADPDEVSSWNCKRNILQRWAFSGVVERDVLELYRVVAETFRREKKNHF